MLRSLILIALTALILSCSNDNDEADSVSIKTDSSSIRYAKNFKVYREGDHKIIEVLEPFPGATKSAKYRLVPRNTEPTNIKYSETIIKVPVQSLVCTSTTHIAPLDMLNVSDKLVGFPSTQYISSKNVRKQVDNGITIELGKDSDLNLELLMDLSPELLMSYSMTGDYSKLTPIERIGIPTVMNAEFLEETPLGRAEWIKFIALFFNKEELADSIFNEIESNYLNTIEQVGSAEKQPTVMSGVVYGDIWYTPGGQSWAAKFFKDAGANYLWQSDSTSGSIPLSFESVYEKAQNAEYWIGIANYFSNEELKAQDNRYANFGSYKSGNLFTYNARAIENGGNDYFESGYSRPDIILNDLVKILHPKVLLDHELYYFRKLDNTNSSEEPK